MKSKPQIYLALAGICILVYFNSFFCGFVYNDTSIIFAHPFISRPSHFLLDPANLLYSLNFVIAKNNPLIYHVTNVLLHTINTILIFIFLRLFFRTEASFLGAMLFAVHPVHTEAVTWILGRGSVITALSILGIYLLYSNATYGEDRNEKKRASSQKIEIIPYCASLLLFSYSLIPGYSFYLAVPFFLILSDITFHRARRNWKWWVPFLMILATRIMLAYTVSSAGIDSAVGEVETKSSWDSLPAGFIYSIFTHFWLLIWPARLTPFHQPISVSASGIQNSAGGAVLGTIGLCLLVIALPFLFRKAKEIFFGIALFILFLSPTYGPITVTPPVAERYLYFPSVLLCIVFAFFYDRYPFQTKNGKLAAVILLLFIIAAYAARTVTRNSDWRDQSRLWRVTLEASPLNATAHNNMGYAYQKEGNVEMAIKEFMLAIRLQPDLFDAYNNVGGVYHRLGRLQEAADTFKDLLDKNPNFFKAYNNLGLIFHEMGKAAEAQAAFQKAIEINPVYAVAYYNLSLLYDKTGRENEAQAAYRKAIELDPALEGLPHRP